VVEVRKKTYDARHSQLVTTRRDLITRKMSLVAT